MPQEPSLYKLPTPFSPAPMTSVMKTCSLHLVFGIFLADAAASNNLVPSLTCYYVTTPRISELSMECDDLLGSLISNGIRHWCINKEVCGPPTSIISTIARLIPTLMTTFKLEISPTMRVKASLPGGTRYIPPLLHFSPPMLGFKVSSQSRLSPAGPFYAEYGTTNLLLSGVIVVKKATWSYPRRNPEMLGLSPPRRL